MKCGSDAWQSIPSNLPLSHTNYVELLVEVRSLEALTAGREGQATRMVHAGVDPAAKRMTQRAS